MGCGGSEDKHEAVEVHEPEECCDDTVCDEVRQSCLTFGYKQAYQKCLIDPTAADSNGNADLCVRWGLPSRRPVDA